MECDFSKNYKTKVEDLGIKKIKTGKFDYLSWSHCQKVLKELDPNAHYTIKFNDNNNSYVWGGFVRVEMYFNGKIWEHSYPVLDAFNNGVILHENKWHFITKPTKQNPKPQIKQEVTSFDLNNAQMRGFAKLFSMVTGIGLNIYTGEDVEQYKTLEEYTEGNEAKKAEQNFKDFFRRYKAELTPVVKNILENKNAKEFTTAEQWEHVLKNAKEYIENLKNENQQANKNENQEKINNLFGEK